MYEHSFKRRAMESGRVSLMAIHSFPLWERCAGSLLGLVDGFVIRLNTEDEGSPDIDEIKEFFGNKLIEIIEGGNPKDGFGWREEMLRPLHAIRPNIVITTDSDEVMPFLFRKVLESFENSDKKMLMMSAEMDTIDGREVPQYPSKPHCRAFKWQPDVSYLPYSGYAYPNPFGWKPDLMYNSDLAYRHLAFYTKEMEKAKTSHALKQYGSL